MQRAAYKQNLQTILFESLAQPPLPLDRIDVTDPQNRYRQVQITGKYENQHHLLLDNQVYRGQAGYHVLTPFLLPDQHQAILINRGWVAVGARRDVLPDVALPAKTPTDATPVWHTVVGRLSQPTQPGWRLGTLELLSNIQVIGYVDYDVLSEQLGYRLLPVIVLLDSTQPDGFNRDWQLTSPTGPERHWGYAVQWFALALTLVVIYIVVNMRRGDGQKNGSPNPAPTG